MGQVFEIVQVCFSLKALTIGCIARELQIHNLSNNVSKHHYTNLRLHWSPDSFFHLGNVSSNNVKKNMWQNLRIANSYNSLRHLCNFCLLFVIFVCCLLFVIFVCCLLFVGFLQRDLWMMRIIAQRVSW